MFFARNHRYNPLAQIYALIIGAFAFVVFGVCAVLIFFSIGISLLFSTSDRNNQIEEYNTSVDLWNNQGRMEFSRLQMYLLYPNVDSLPFVTDQDGNNISPRKGEIIEQYEPLKRKTDLFLYGEQRFESSSIPKIRVEIQVNDTVITENIPIFKSKTEFLSCDSRSRVGHHSCLEKCIQKEGELLFPQSSTCRIVERLMSICLVVDVATKQFHNAGRGSGCLASDSFASGTYQVLKRSEYDFVPAQSGTLTIRSSDDPFYRLNRIVGSSLDFDATAAEKRNAGIVLLVIMLAPCCCCVLIVSILAILVGILIKRKKSTPPAPPKESASQPPPFASQFEEVAPFQPYYPQQQSIPVVQSYQPGGFQAPPQLQYNNAPMHPPHQPPMPNYQPPLPSYQPYPSYPQQQGGFPPQQGGFPPQQPDSPFHPI